MIIYFFLGILIVSIETNIYRKDRTDLFQDNFECRLFFFITSILLWPVPLLSMMYDSIAGNGPFKR
jgi:hypothetical protein